MIAAAASSPASSSLALVKPVVADDDDDDSGGNEGGRRHTLVSSLPRTPVIATNSGGSDLTEAVATAVAVAAAAGTAQMPPTVHLHMHHDRTVVHAPSTSTTTTTTTSSSSSSLSSSQRRRHQKAIGVGTVMGSCCQCHTPVVDDASAEQLQYVCSRECGAVVWHVKCAHRALSQLARAKEIVHTCTECGNQLTICASVDAPTRYTSVAQATDAAPGASRLIGWLLFVLGELYFLWPLRIAWMFIRATYYLVRFPIIFLVILPYPTGLIMKVLMYSRAMFDNHIATSQSHGSSFASYYFVWRDSKTQQVGVHSVGWRYDLGHWMFGLVIQLSLVLKLLVLVVLYKAIRLVGSPPWQRVRFAPVASVRPVPRAQAPE